MSAKKHIVIVGYGIGGSNITAKLAKLKKYNITVISPLNYQEVPFAMTYSVAVGSNAHDKYIYDLVKEDGVDYKIATCTSLSDESITLSTGETLSFDLAIVATGTENAVFIPNPDEESSKEARKEVVKKMSETIKAANSIVVSGGGPVGVEVAADIKLTYPTKKVILVHAHGSILSSMSPEFPPLAQANLQKIGVELILNDRVVKFTDGQVTLSSGRIEAADLYLPASAGRPYTKFMPVDTLDDRGFIKVDKTFKVDKLNKIFAYGSCSNISKEKTSVQVDDQLPTLFHNIIQAIDKSTSPSFKQYTPGFLGKIPGPIMVAMGHHNKEGYGVGPDIPALNGCCWLCCCFGFPCSPAAGASVAKAKSDFVDTVTPKKGVGMHR